MAETAPTAPALSRWLRDYNEGAWRRYLERLRAEGSLAHLDGILVDTGALLQTRFRCDSDRCAKAGGREQSCCTHYDVEVTSEERDRIFARAPAVIEFLSRVDPARVKPSREINEFFAEELTIQLRKEHRRCSFSFRDSGGKLWCGLHALALERGLPVESIKPVTCLLFPLVVYRFEDGDTLLTASSRHTESMFDGGAKKPSKLLVCIREQDGPPMYQECRAAIEFAFGKGFFGRLDSLARAEQAETLRSRHP
jgi:hypothetical protein